MDQSGLLREIISVERERRDLLAKLTPTTSLWKQVDSQTTWTIARKEEPATATARDDDAENQLADYFNLMLQDMEDLGHRMLSMLYFLNKSNDPICSYKATELCDTTAKLNMQISKGFSTNQEQEQEQEQEPEPGQINLSTLFRKYYRFPNNYENTLSQLGMGEKETKCEDVKVKKTKKEEDKENDPSTIEYFKKSLELDQYFFAEDRTYWENGWASKIGRCGGFANTIILSPMQFTHYTPGTIPSRAAVTGSTLQIYSIKIKNLKGLNWPLKVYGMVAARDTVDRNRNILFSRPKFDYQELNGEDDSLCLTGPSRAIVALGHVDFEVELNVIEAGESQILNICRGRYGGTDDCSSSSANLRCTLEQLDRSHGDWPFKYGCRVICFWAPASAADDIDTTCTPVLLLDRRGKGLHRRSKNYLQLSRKVVSVESQGTLRVAIEAYGKSHRWIARKGHMNFPVQQCQTSTRDCSVGDATVEVVVAWSLLVKQKVDLQAMLLLATTRSTGTNYSIGYYLENDIYPPWATFAKTIPPPKASEPFSDPRGDRQGQHRRHKSPPTPFTRIFDDTEFTVAERSFVYVVRDTGGTACPQQTRMNYIDWVVLMHVMMEGWKLWEVMHTGTTEHSADRLAPEAILHGVLPEMASTLASKATAKEAWDTVKTMRLSVAHDREVKLTTIPKQYSDIRISDGETIDDFAMRITNMVAWMAQLGETMPEKLVFPKRYSQIAPSKSSSGRSRPPRRDTSSTRPNLASGASRLLRRRGPLDPRAAAPRAVGR
ncbi:hypothetical protein VPH35_041661 [Triticum aestivum]